MSAYCQIKTVYKDANVLIEALKQAGFTEVENHLGNKQALVGYSHEPTMYADIIVRQKYSQGFCKDFGFAKNPDGTFAAVVNDMDSSKFETKHRVNIANNYAEKVVRNKMKALGLRSTGAKKVGNKLVLEYVQV